MNRLSDQTSPYLLQHAGDPVDWHPWDEEALALARHENKPILLSIGYSANHQCHVMARESFESVQVAALMNEHFVNILVDREERPDLDRIYQTAHGLLNRRPGGWPLTMMLDPKDHLPFFGGTYFPPQPRQQVPSFREVLKGIAKMYGTKNKQMDEFKAKFSGALAQVLGGNAPQDIDVTLIERACGQIDGSFDAEHGGFSESPKFPHPAGLDLLLDAAHFADDEAQSKRALYMLDFTLSAMSRGGLFDQLGGGFFRDSVDAEWTIPHFEKMLYDNAMLLSLYARRARQTGLPWFREVANQTADWMMREMQLEDGGLCCSLDADTEGAEGAYYLWSADDLKRVLGDDHDALAPRFGVDRKANFAGCWHLRLSAPEPEPAPGTGTDDPVADLGDARARLLAERNLRARPARDDKIVTSWNALAIRGLADAGDQLGREDCLAAASRAVDHLQAMHSRNGTLCASSRGGQARSGANLDDYAFLLDAVLVLLGVRWRDSDLRYAVALADAMLEHFEDRQQGGFFFTANGHRDLIQRTKSFSDDSMPSGNAVAVRGLLELGNLVGESRYLEAAERGLRAGMTDAGRWPSAHATLMRALIDFTRAPPRVVLRCSAGADVAPWLAMAAERLSARSRCYVIPSDGETSPAFDVHRGSIGGAAVTAYLYLGKVSCAPVTSLADFAELAKSGAPGSMSNAQ